MIADIATCSFFKKEKKRDIIKKQKTVKPNINQRGIPVSRAKIEELPWR